MSAEITMSRKCLVQAIVEIRKGDRCVVNYGSEKNSSSEDFRFYINCNSHTAVVEGVNEAGRGLDLRMTSGPRSGEIFFGVNPEVLLFQEGFRRED